MKHRCFWVTDSKLYQEYHDHEWGQPVYDDETLFEFLVLETFQAGLSWITILNKRENFRKVFDIQIQASTCCFISFCQPAPGFEKQFDCFL